ncbi:uncharacterized protein LOC133330239 [Musca vetustissima]|uniref:uncharacterized protein LOC133330239 n=1 Tax=Musca vetustissima TaxID=27455 RepID=UPI002AB6CA95|nr:uncharacterized protein LOC133330239 [Musca vetustissima]
MKFGKLVSLSLLVVAMLLFNGSDSKEIRKRGVMDNFNEGLKFAGQMFGINTAADVANLVAKAFSKTASKGNSDLLSSLVQKGLKSKPSKVSSPSSTEEYINTKKYDSQESGRDQNHQQTNERHEEKPQSSKEKVGLDLNTTQFVTSILRMVGFDATKLGALAINVLIMVASTIATTLLGNNTETGPEEHYSPTEHQPRMLSDGTPIDWFLQNPSKKMKSLLNDAIDTSLTDKITNMISSYEREEGQTSCVKMLMCKSAPFIWGMQKSIKKRITGDVDEDEKSAKGNDKKQEEDRRLFDVDSMYRHFPSLEEFREHADKCEKLYSNYCNITKIRQEQFN